MSTDPSKTAPTPRLTGAPATAPISAVGANAATVTKAQEAEKKTKPKERARSSVFSVDTRYEGILKSLGIYDVFRMVSERRQFLAPFEMRAAINPQATAQLAEQHYARWAPFFDGLRNVLVVLPLTLTWLSLAVAALAYNQSLPLIKNSVKPDFFQLWQQGFPQLTSVRFLNWTIPLVTQGTHIHYWTFTDVAMLDVAILLMMLLLTALSQITTASAIRRARALETYLIKQLHMMSMDSQMWSLNIPDDQPAWASQILPVIESLTNTLGVIDTSVDTFGKQMIKQGEVIEKAVGQVGNVPVAVTELVKIYNQALLLQNALNDALPNIQRDLSKVTESQDLTAANWIRLAEQFHISTESMAQIADELTGSDRMRAALRMSDMNYSGMNNKHSEPWWRRVWPFG